MRDLNKLESRAVSPASAAVTRTDLCASTSSPLGGSELTGGCIASGGEVAGVTPLALDDFFPFLQVTFLLIHVWAP